MMTAHLPRLNRRAFLAAAATLPVAGRAHAAQPALSVVTQAPFMVSGVAVAQDETVFLGMPRFASMDNTYSVARVRHDGTPKAFPGGAWNAWRPGQDGTAAFVMVNAVHIFGDNTLWVVDQGAPPGQTPQPGAQKLVQIGTRNGQIMRVLTFPDSIMPPGAQFNDLRLRGDLLFITDSGLGGIIIHNLKTGHTLRRLSGQNIMRNDNAHLHKGNGGRILRDINGKRPQVQSDQLEIDPSGRWLYFSVPAGPLKKVWIADLLDPTLSDTAIAQRVRLVADIPSIGGTCIDTRGNIYLADAEHSRIVVLAPDNRRETLVQDHRLLSPDALFIDRARRLYIPCPQIERLPMFNNGVMSARAPFFVLSMPLPDQIRGIPLGNAEEG